MLLYSLRNIHSKRFFVHFDGRGHLDMCQHPVFWKKPDSVWKNLKRACSRMIWIANPLYPWSQGDKNWIDFDPTLLANWEVIITGVTLKGEKQIPAIEFVVVPQLTEMNVGMGFANNRRMKAKART